MGERLPIFMGTTYKVRLKIAHDLVLIQRHVGIFDHDGQVGLV